MDAGPPARLSSGPRHSKWCALLPTGAPCDQALPSENRSPSVVVRGGGRHSVDLLFLMGACFPPLGSSARSVSSQRLKTRCTRRSCATTCSSRATRWRSGLRAGRTRRSSHTSWDSSTSDTGTHETSFPCVHCCRGACDRPPDTLIPFYLAAMPSLPSGMAWSSSSSPSTKAFQVTATTPSRPSSGTNSRSFDLHRLLLPCPLVCLSLCLLCPAFIGSPTSCFCYEHVLTKRTSIHAVRHPSQNCVVQGPLQVDNG